MYYNNRDVRLEEIPTPSIGPGELMVKVLASGICGSDVMEWYRIKKAPRVLGHEIAGEIVKAGEGVERYKAGERVFVSHHVPCNTCHYCLNGFHTVCDTLRTTNFDPGGFAEYIRVPRINVDRGVFILPEEVSFEDGVFIEPLACVLRGQRLAKFRPGQSVFVIGSGISGLLHVALARASGAGRIIASDINEYRLKAARNLEQMKPFMRKKLTLQKFERSIKEGWLIWSLSVQERFLLTFKLCNLSIGEEQSYVLLPLNRVSISLFHSSMFGMMGSPFCLLMGVALLTSQMPLTSFVLIVCPLAK